MRLAKTALQLLRPWLKLKNNKIESYQCTRGDIQWCLDLNEGIDFSIFLLGAFEKRSIQKTQQLIKPGDIVLDIGANIGAYTLPMAQFVGQSGRVYAFEPTEWAFEKLKRNIKENSELAARIKAEQIFLGRAGKAPEKIHASWSLQDGFNNRTELNATMKVTSGCEQISLDDYVQKNSLQRVDFIKLDVDGFEVEVLQGAKSVLKNFRPKLILELCPHALATQGTSLTELLNLLTEYKYKLANLEETKFPDRSEIVSRLPRGGGGNYIAVPT